LSRDKTAEIWHGPEYVLGKDGSINGFEMRDLKRLRARQHVVFGNREFAIRLCMPVTENWRPSHFDSWMESAPS
jgi:hypothetical protein